MENPNPTPLVSNVQAQDQTQSKQPSPTDISGVILRFNQQPLIPYDVAFDLVGRIHFLMFITDLIEHDKAEAVRLLQRMQESDMREYKRMADVAKLSTTEAADLLIDLGSAFEDAYKTYTSTQS